MKNLIKIYLVLAAWSFWVSNDLNAQTILNISNNNLVQNGGYLVLKNTKLQNDGTLQANDGTVVISGDAANSNSAIAGTSLTTFYNLEINKTSNGTQLENDINIANQLTLTSGNIDIQSYDLTIQNTTNISGGSANSYVKTSDIGVLIQEVSNSNVVFPVGNQSYTPVTLNNSGAIDDFNVRVENVVYENGTSGNAITTDVVDATWFIDEASAGSSNITATFQWNGSDEMTDFDRTQAFISNYDNNQWNNGTASAASGSNPYTLTQSGISQLSPFIIASDANVLPVELLYFYGEKVDEGVLLNWETATEINNSHFDIEWSIDGISFEKIGEVAGSGTTNESQFYEFLDNRTDIALQGLHYHYYRLKQVDFDNKYEYTNIIQITIEFPTTIGNDNKRVSIYPNPAAHYLKIESQDLIGETVQVFNVNGQLVKEFQHLPMAIGTSITNVPITNLPNGTYFVKIGEQIKKLIIEK